MIFIINIVIIGHDIGRQYRQYVMDANIVKKISYMWVCERVCVHANLQLDIVKYSSNIYKHGMLNHPSSSRLAEV